MTVCKLPEYLIITPNGMELTRKPRNMTSLKYLQLLVKGNIESVVVAPKLTSHDLYCNENAMLETQPFNPKVNPYMNIDCLLATSRLSGPFGVFVLHKKSGLNYSNIRQAIQSYETEQDEDGYLDEFNKAVTDYTTYWTD